MEAPLLFALAHARLLAGGGAVQGVWASQRALGLAWAPDRKAGVEPGTAWVFILNPAPELWTLSEKGAAYSLLRAESKTDLSRRWSLELKGARLCDIEGDPRERWIAFEMRRRAITGRIEGMKLAFQAIPGRGGLRLDGLDLNPARVGMGTPFPAKQPDCEPDTPPMRKWRERWGDGLDAALHGRIADVLPGEGPLLHRHAAWSLERAEKLLLAPKKQAETRKIQKERLRLERYGEALKSDMERHKSMLLLREPAMRLQAELWRLKGATRSVELLDGTRIDLPPGQRVEETVQRWFNSVKKAERGLERVAMLEKERVRQVLEMGAPEGGDDATGATNAPSGGCGAASAPGGGCGAANAPGGGGRAKAEQERRKVGQEKNGRRADGKGRAYRSQMVGQFEVLIGRGDADNDNLTFRVADPQDFWLHVANLPGSHVIIRNPDRLGEPPRAALERAAELAAFYSKARDGGKVEVHWCRVADVNKPRGFEPGKVILKSHKSVKVYPRG